MNEIVSVDWEMTENDSKVISTRVHESREKPSDAYSWSLRNNDLTAISAFPLVGIRMKLALVAYNEAVRGGRLFKKHHFEVIDDPFKWTSAAKDMAFWIAHRPLAKDSLRYTIKDRLGEIQTGHPRNFPLRKAGDIREERARKTLCNIIGKREFREYIRKGFVTVMGCSGRSYQVFAGNSHTRVFERGKNIKNLCAVFGDPNPANRPVNPYEAILRRTLQNGAENRSPEPIIYDQRNGYCQTDSVIMRTVLIRADEVYFESLCRIHEADDPYTRYSEYQNTDSRSLPEIYKDICKLVA